MAFLSQLIQYARACSSYECFILRSTRLSSRLLGQGYVRKRLKSTQGSFAVVMGYHQTLWSLPLPNITWHSGHDHIQWHPQLIRHYTNLWIYYRTGPYYRFWPYHQISGGFHRTLQRVRLANKGRLLLRTPCPVLFETCICFNVDTFFPELVMSTDLLSFEHPSVLLFCFFKLSHLTRMPSCDICNVWLLFCLFDYIPTCLCIVQQCWNVF